MRVPPPGLLKLDREALLRDVRERLIERLPHYAETDIDPTDPGWLLLEQSAWLVEMLSEQLDQYPFSVVQQFVHMMGGHLLPAHPSLGVISAQVAKEGELVLDPKRESPWRFYTPQNESMDSIEFVPAESGVDLRTGYIQSMCQYERDELFLVGPTEVTDGIEGHEMWREGTPRPSSMFTNEVIRYVAVSNNTDTLIEALNNAVELLEERRIGWLDLEVKKIGKEKVELIAKVAPGKAFARVAPAGIWMGGDLEGDWNTLDGTTWTPPVTIAPHSLLPRHLHHQFPLPGYEEGQILLTDIPENFAVDELLVRRASPTPEIVVEAIWKTLGNLDSRLFAMKPSIHVDYSPHPAVVDLEPDWVQAVVKSRMWSEVSQGQPSTLFQVALTGTTKRKKASRARIAVVYETANADAIRPARFFGIDAKGEIDQTKLKATEAWRIALPPKEGGRRKVMPTVVAYDVTIGTTVKSVLGIANGNPSAMMLNALLVTNMPVVADGRTVQIERNIPLELTMLFEDLVTSRVRDRMLEEPIPPRTAAVIRELSLSHFSVVGQDPIIDWAGVRVDPSEGSCTLNAPNDEGSMRPFRPGARMRLDWYRRTDGANGNVGPNSIRLNEQGPTVKPSINAVNNPLATFYGADREVPESAIERMFGPVGGTPVLASDFERLVRQALGSRGRGWHVRCWTYAERALVSSAVWPVVGAAEEPEPESVELEQRMAEAGPETLLVVVGPKNEVLSDEDLDWAKRSVGRMIQRLSQRLPTVKKAVVTRFWGLTMEVPEHHGDPFLPMYDVQEMYGDVVDVLGRSPAAMPRAILMLNAAVTEVVVRQQEVL